MCISVSLTGQHDFQFQSSNKGHNAYLLAYVYFHQFISLTGQHDFQF